MLRVIAILPLMLLTGAVPGQGSIEVEVLGLRNAKGVIHVCVTQSAAHFPDCKGDPSAHSQTISAASPKLRISSLFPGRYAVTLFHDENGNQRLDKLLGIPREGFGFSRNPVIRFGAPQFDKVGIDVRSGFTRVSVRMQYLL
jgi:uncharacterized protein (DUF2141 family)